MAKAGSYAPDDAHLTVEVLEFLRTSEGVRLREAVAGISQGEALSVSQVAGLRKEFPANAVAAALTLAGTQTRGRIKFSDVPFIWAPPEALEQATGSVVARHKASRFAAARAERIVDLCAGIGGDALALADIAPTLAVDLSPLRLACLRWNAHDRLPRPRFALTTRVADVRDVLGELSNKTLVHIDPARRSEGRRSAAYRDLIPGPEVLENVCEKVRGVAIKLSPAVDFRDLPRGPLELISFRGTVVQAVLWRGELAARLEERTATICRDGEAPFCYMGQPEESVVDAHAADLLRGDPVTAWLYEVDGALTRAGLAAAFAAERGLVPLTRDGGYLWGIGAQAPPTPALRAFRVLRVLPYSERAVSKVLAILGTSSEVAEGTLEVKSRGGKAALPGVDTDRLQQAWAKVCRKALCVLLFALDKRIYAVVAQRA